jgi:hypothetical protein
MNELDEEVLFGNQVPTKYVTPNRKLSRSGNLLPATNAAPNKLDHSSTNPLINKLHTMRSTITTCPEIWSSRNRK